MFRNCAYFDVFITHLYGTEPRDVLIENNVFERTFQWNGQKAPYGLMVANWLSKMENFTIRNNTFETEVAMLSRPPRRTCGWSGTSVIAVLVPQRRPVLAQRLDLAPVRPHRPSRGRARCPSSSTAGATTGV